MTFADGWTCRACWKSNRPQDPICYRCKTARRADEAGAAGVAAIAVLVLMYTHRERVT